MQFKTTIPKLTGSFSFSHQQKILLVGSCFSNEIGTRLQQSGFNAVINPFGTLFNPVSIGTSLDYIVRNKLFTENDFHLFDGIWKSFLLHSNFSGTNRDVCVNTINKTIKNTHSFLHECDVLIITYGSAWVYVHNDTGTTVANCHKQPQQLFTKRKLGVNDIVAESSLLLEHLKGANPKLKIIFTVSPVKHLKDGFVENNWSKSTLNVAIHELVRRFDFCEYYPSYEILNDDLRDYRFYKNDMVHPNDLATQYIFEHFTNAYCSQETIQIAKDFTALTKMAEHKPMHGKTNEYDVFLTEFKNKAQTLMPVNPAMVETLLTKLSEQ